MGSKRGMLNLLMVKQNYMDILKMEKKRNFMKPKMNFGIIL